MKELFVDWEAKEYGKELYRVTRMDGNLMRKKFNKQVIIDSAQGTVLKYIF